MSRELAIARAVNYFESGALKADLARRIAIATESRLDCSAELVQYIEAEMRPAFEALGFRCQLMQAPGVQLPFLFAARIENTALPTVFSYAHGDVIRGLDSGWNRDLTPWKLIEDNGRYYGRGVADNKGQHTINLGALAAVLRTRGCLGFNHEMVN